MSDFNAVHKVVYGSGVPTLIPDFAKVQKDIEFASSTQLGDFFEQAVRLALPGGFTRKKGDGTAGAFTMNGAKGGVLKKAKVYGFQLTLRDIIAYEDLAKAAQAGPQAYKAATALFWEGLQLSIRKQLEIMCLYGNKGIGTIGTYSASNASYGNQPTIQVTESEWAPMLLSGYEGATISIMNGTSGTKRSDIDIAGLDVENRVIILSGTVTGATANDVIYFQDGYGAEMQGLKDLFTASGTVLGVDNSLYSLWKPSQIALGNKSFSFQFLKKGLSAGMGKGLMHNIEVYASTGGVEDLIGDIHQLRNVDKSEVKKIELGTDEVVYKFGGITANVKAHPMVKNGDAFGVVTQFAKRVGSKDIGFGMPGRGDEKVWFDLQDKAGMEGRMYTHQSIFTEQMGINVMWTGIKNKSL